MSLSRVSPLQDRKRAPQRRGHGLWQGGQVSADEDQVEALRLRAQTSCNEWSIADAKPPIAPKTIRRLMWLRQNALSR